jgi:hypothetical protein
MNLWIFLRRQAGFAKPTMNGDTMTGLVSEQPSNNGAETDGNPTQ